MDIKLIASAEINYQRSPVVKMLRILLRNRVRYNPPCVSGSSISTFSSLYVLQFPRVRPSWLLCTPDAIQVLIYVKLWCKRTPESPLRGHIQKVQIFQNFIRTILANFHPNFGFGLQLLSEFRIWPSTSIRMQGMASPESNFQKKKISVSVVSLASGVFSTPSNPSTLIKWRCFIIDFNDFGCLHEISARGYKKYREDV